MSKTTIVNLKTDAYDVRIDRRSIFGNPFAVGRDGTRAEVIEKYAAYFYGRIETDRRFRAAVERLRGKRLGCWCKPLPCHGDVIARYLEEDDLDALIAEYQTYENEVFQDRRDGE